MTKTQSDVSLPHVNVTIFAMVIDHGGELNVSTILYDTWNNIRHLTQTEKYMKDGLVNPN